MRKKARVIAFYLPQYHPTENNNIWWGKGFTEWTNVGKAKPLYKGHYQPKVPADLGYYDLRLPEIRYEQTKLARKAGIDGFCYYHYWFGNGRMELERPFQEVLNLNEPQFPFCLCWANESWHCKFWNMDGTFSSKLLVEQKYDDEEGHKKHFYHLLPAFKDESYIKVNGKPLFYIYQPLAFSDISRFISLWNDLAVKNGLAGFHFVGQTPFVEKIDEIIQLGFDAVNVIKLFEFKTKIGALERLFLLLRRKMFSRPLVVKYSNAMKFFIGPEAQKENVYPTIIPNWDHTPRSGKGGCVLDNSTPILFQKQASEAFEMIKDKTEENKIVFLKSWNEWGEGNYMEPDLKYGHGFIDALSEIIYQE